MIGYELKYIQAESELVSFVVQLTYDTRCLGKSLLNASIKCFTYISLF